MACGMVAVGLIIEYRSDFRKAVAERSLKLLPLGALLVTLGVALEFAFQVRTSVLISEVRGIQQKQASDANERAGKAEKDAAEAKLALAKMNADRVLTEGQISELVKILSPYAGNTYWAVPEKGPQDEDSEQERLTNQLIRVFTAAGWKKENHW